MAKMKKYSVYYKIKKEWHSTTISATNIAEAKTKAAAIRLNGGRNIKVKLIKQF